MVINESRQQAMELTKSFCDAVSIGSGKTIDFYKMLWIVHWAIEQYGWSKTREMLETIMLAPDFEPVNAPLLLRDALLKQAVQEDPLGNWFVKALQSVK